MAVVQQGTLLLVTFCILTLWLTSTLLGCYEEEDDGAPPHHEGTGKATTTSTPGEGRAEEVGTQQHYYTLDNDEEYQQKLKGEMCSFFTCPHSQPIDLCTLLEDLLPLYLSECHHLSLSPPNTSSGTDIVLWFQSEMESVPIQPSCPIHVSFSEEQSTPSDTHLVTFGSLHLPDDSNQSVSLLTDILKEVSSALPRLDSALVAQLGPSFGGTTLDSKTANSLAGLLK